MCGRYVAPDEADIERFWHLGRDYNPLRGIVARYNVAPTTQVPILFVVDSALELHMARWGLVPMWWSKPKPPNFTFNTRIEEAAQKPMWRQSLKEFRCIVPALGWYEWKEVEVVDKRTGEVKRAKQPYFIHLPGRQMIGFAGIMAPRWADPEKSGLVYSCSILTKEAEGPAAEVHSRMPVILPQAAHAAWMDRKQQDAGAVLENARLVAVQDVECYPVSQKVNVAKNQGAELIEPFPNPA